MTLENYLNTEPEKIECEIRRTIKVSLDNKSYLTLLEKAQESNCLVSDIIKNAIEFFLLTSKLANSDGNVIVCSGHQKFKIRIDKDDRLERCDLLI